MIKVINLVSLIIAPIVVQYQEFNIWTVSVIVIGLALLVWAIWRSRSGGAGFGMSQPKPPTGRLVVPAPAGHD